MKKRKHILVVEDEAHLAIGIKYALEKSEGYRVTTTNDGRTALQAIKDDTQDVDLIILDLMLPGTSGYDICETLRSLGHDLPVLILSARTLTEDRTRGFDVGADQYLTKPFDLDELLSRVRNLLLRYDRRMKRQAEAASTLSKFEFGEAVIDFDTFEVTVAGQTVRLTQLEMTLLRYFIENEGRVIPRSELLENVWNTAGTIATRAPDQFIRRLRKAFEPDPAEPKYFLTIRDAGYRFVSHTNG